MGHLTTQPQDKPPFMDWKELETFYDLTVCMSFDFAQGRLTEKEWPDSRVRFHALILWAQDFNSLHVHTIWGDEGKDYFDCVNQYYVERLSNHLG